MFPEWFQPFEYIDFVSVEGKLQQIWRGSGGDKNSENMLVFRININSNFSSSILQTHLRLGPN